MGIEKNSTTRKLTFKHNYISKRIIMLYGFINGKESYDVTLTLLKIKTAIKIYGFLSKIRLEPDEFRKVWYYIKKNFDVRYLIFEVLLKHSPVYKHYLPVISCKKSKTFNGYDSEILVIDLGGKLNGKKAHKVKELHTILR